MKKGTLISTLILSLVLVGCGKSEEEKQKEADKELLKGEPVKIHEHKGY